MRANRIACWAVVSVGLLAASGCRSTEAPRTAARPAETAADASTPAVAALREKPLYRFTEEEVGAYVADVRRETPELTERVVRLARQNIGQPYEIYLLGEYPFETYDPDPLYCLSKSDCLVFTEHMYAMALSRDWWSFLQVLQRIRYRDGVVGMVSRNHFTIADWNRNNAFFLEDITARLGGGAVQAPLTQVCRRARFFKQWEIGQDIPDEPIESVYVPKANVPQILSELRDGDFVNIVRGNASSQYCGHTGFVAIGADGEVNFLHSARPTVREERLVGYLESDARCLGVRFLRPRADAQERMDAAIARRDGLTPITEASLRDALALSPLNTPYSPSWRATDWRRVSRLQGYRLPHDVQQDEGLRRAVTAADSQVREELGIREDERGFGVLDLTDLRVAMLNGDQMFYGASVPKIVIVLAYLAEHPDVSKLDPEVQRELELVIKHSSNELAAKYSQIVGLEDIQALIQSDRYGFYDAEHGGGFWCGKHYGLAQPRTGDPVHDHSHGVTTRQALRFYLMMEQGRLESAAVSAKLQEIFAAERLAHHEHHFLKGLNGRNVGVLRKSGLWENWHLDTARVLHGDRVYVIAGMVEHPKGGEYLARMAAAVDDLLVESAAPRPALLHERVTLRPEPARWEGAYVSDVIEAPIWFDELVMSWNIADPSGEGFAVDVRVSSGGEGEAWSPWLRMGEWGDWPLEDADRVMQFEGGRVDVDYFVGNRSFDRAQFRVRSGGSGDGDEALFIERVDLTFSDTSGVAGVRPLAARAAAEPAEGVWRRRIAIPFRNQRTPDPALSGRICSPTSLGMVLAYHGSTRTTQAVSQRCYDPVHGIYGNWSRNIQAAFDLGVEGYLTRISDWDEAKAYIAAGQPLIVSIQMDEGDRLAGASYGAIGGHLIVITGFDGAGGAYVSDSAYGSAEEGERVYSLADLTEIWLKKKHGLAYILASRGQDGVSAAGLSRSLERSARGN